MAAGAQGSTPHHKPTLFLFIDFCRLCLDLIYMIIKWLFHRSVRSSMLLDFVRLISRCNAVPQCFMYLLPQSLSARARFADPIQIPLRPCLPCSCLPHAVLLVVDAPCSCRSTVRIPSSYIRVRTPSSSCYRASFLTDNTSRISCHVRRFIRHAIDNSRVIAGYSLNFP